ncbi:DUF3592 domain-containing protein [Haloechinothrix sp. LS1_15]|uniref:DUF3592 domain-containing protein n=1 Tax=Haloechinothrix sp. LS1_15 TaxID=2652248 RepID=UPI0029461F22|nr:DUF3592 domain-containing protein [Haloechinothrix sp. LS1_15]MDV6013192.1 hypothetical protein [Haloechinothrix sp. LS1_15]
MTRTPGRLRLFGFRAVLTVACLVTLLALGLVIAAFRNDARIDSSLGTANAEVTSVERDRAVVRFETADGTVHIPPNGVLYSHGLAEGQLVAVEFATDDPALVRVAERTAMVTLLPLGSTVLVVWLVATPLLLWLRRGEREHARTAVSGRS